MLLGRRGLLRTRKGKFGACRLRSQYYRLGRSASRQSLPCCRYRTLALLHIPPGNVAGAFGFDYG